MLKKSTLIILILMALVGVFVSRVKYEVAFLRKTLVNMNDEIEKYSDDLKVCAAEWSYLNSPKRLRELGSKYLKNMRSTELKQIIDYETFLNSDLKAFSGNSLSKLLDDIAK
jgi:hypothetical protein